jgi:hypothetical protein
MVRVGIVVASTCSIFRRKGVSVGRQYHNACFSQKNCAVSLSHDCVENETSVVTITSKLHSLDLCDRNHSRRTLWETNACRGVLRHRRS